MRPHLALASVGLAAALSLGLAGCFSPSPSAPSAASPDSGETTPPTQESAPPALAADPAIGVILNGTGYSVNAPEGWTVPADAPTAADIFAVSVPDAEGFYSTVNVLLAPANDDSADTREIRGVAYLEGLGATDVQIRPRVAIAGVESVHITADRTSSSGLDYRSEQYVVTSSGLDYTVTFVFNVAAPQADREALAESVLASWMWTP
jgi:hypothetical protein